MNMKQFELTYFFGPAGDLITDAVFADIAQSGMTLCQLRDNPENNKKALDLCAKYGLKAVCTDPRLYQALKSSWQEKDALIQKICADYADHPAFYGYDILDEPNEQVFDALSEIVSLLRKYDPAHETIINLFPNYATPEQLGNPTYEDHLAQFVARVKPDFISYDHYHFLGRGKPKPSFAPTGDRRSDMILENAYLENDRPGFFENAQAVRNCANANDIEAMAIVLLTEHGPYRNLTREELAWEAGMCLAYGFKRVSYFTYMQPSDSDPTWVWDNAMIDVKGNRYPHWYDVQAISAWLLPLGRHLFPLSCEKIVHTADSSPLNHHGIRGVSGNTVCGCFDDGSVLIVNKNHAQPSEITIDADSVMRYLAEEDRFIPGDLTICLEAGQCVLMK